MNALRKHLTPNPGTIAAVTTMLVVLIIGCGAANTTTPAPPPPTDSTINQAAPTPVPLPSPPGDMLVPGKLEVKGVGIFGNPGIGEGGEIQLVEGEHGIRWFIDNMKLGLRWYNMGGEPSPNQVMFLSPEGELHIIGPLRAGGAKSLDAAIFESPDIVLRADSSWGRGDGGRALVHGNDDTLILNYDEDFDGGVEVQGAFQSSRIIERNLQTAQEQQSAAIGRFSQGDLLCWDAGAGRLETCSELASPLVVAVADERGKPIVLGAEPIKVLGPVRPGDLLVASTVPGCAIAWSQISTGPVPVGVVIAKALESFDGEQGLIQAMILNQ